MRFCDRIVLLCSYIGKCLTIGLMTYFDATCFVAFLEGVRYNNPILNPALRRTPYTPLDRPILKKFDELLCPPLWKLSPATDNS